MRGMADGLVGAGVCWIEWWVVRRASSCGGLGGMSIPVTKACPYG